MRPQLQRKAVFRTPLSSTECWRQEASPLPSASGHRPPPAVGAVSRRAKMVMLDMPLGDVANFPLRYIDDEGYQHVLTTPSQAELTVEFCNDYDPPYRCIDADDNRVRLLVWNVRLLLCQIIPDDFDPALLEVWQQLLPSSGPRLVEVYQGLALRAINRTTRGVEPRIWSAVVTTWPAPTQAEHAYVTATDFDREWLHLRLSTQA